MIPRRDGQLESTYRRRWHVVSQCISNFTFHVCISSRDHGNHDGECLSGPETFHLIAAAISARVDFEQECDTDGSGETLAATVHVTMKDQEDAMR